jgi:NTP pyrophosphatase (non-canonical NTP hydrolase)
MKESFDELYEILKKDRNNSPWSKSRSLKDRVEGLRGEVEEIMEAMEKEDIENLKEEIGDALWDMLAVVIIAEEKYELDPKEMLQNIIKKIKRRKPWILNEHDYTVEKEVQLWKEAKDKEKKK